MSAGKIAVHTYQKISMLIATQSTTLQSHPSASTTPATAVYSIALLAVSQRNVACGFIVEGDGLERRWLPGWELRTPNWERVVICADVCRQGPDSQLTEA